MITLEKELNGRILDIGGGGEGIIGRLYTDQVVAIDIRQSELDEAPMGFEKILMDATDLKFNDNSFDHVTSFYTLMFMDSEDQKSAVLEATRVLKNHGELHIWDCDILSAYPEPFCVDVSVQLPDKFISTTYGVGKMGSQDENSIVEMCLNSGLILVAKNIVNVVFICVSERTAKFQFIEQ